MSIDIYNYDPDRIRQLIENRAVQPSVIPKRGFSCGNPCTLARRFGRSNSITDEASKLKPKPSTCVGCRNYFGETYGGNMLICAIHPYGWESEGMCCDYEPINLDETIKSWEE